jgi:dolichol-phosphate mannosyltransferase
MSINSVVQWLVPPPKYHIDALMPCDLAERAPIGHVFIMERGRRVTRRLSVESALGSLIENTDDAYGFPPFATFAPHIRIGSDDYGALRLKEVALLKSALARAEIYRVRTPGHEWGAVIPSIVEGRPVLVGEPIEVGGDYDRPRLVPVPIVSETSTMTVPDQVRSDTA